MNIDAAAFVLERQLAWARRHDIPLLGSKGERGRRTYANPPDRNLFEPLSTDVRDEYNNGDGRELGGHDGNPGKMQALHSSAALSRVRRYCILMSARWSGRSVPDITV